VIALGRNGRPLRIGYGRIFHEACAYSPLETTNENFTALHHMEGEELAKACSLRGTELASFMPHAELSGFNAAARAAGDVETVPLVSSMAVPSGPVTAETFAWLLDGMLGAIERAGTLDGVYLALHGSMQVEGLDEAPEAVILRRVRALVGADVKIAVSYDLHANLSAGLVDPVDVLIAYRTNPHWDLAPTGFRAGNRLIRALRGQCTPVHAWRKLPMVLGGGMTIDFMAPMRNVFRWMKKIERDPRVLSASLFMVHPYTNADDLGWAVHVCTDGDRALASELADELADRAWAVREVPMPPVRSVEEGLDEAASTLWRRVGPITIVDCADIVGAGAPGGNTHIARALALHDRGLRAFVPIHDPALLEEAWRMEIGERFDAVVRGTPGYDQPELHVRAKLMAKATAESGRMVRLDYGTVSLAITERPPLPIHPKFWRALDLEPRKADVIVQKNFFHYRIFYATTLSLHHIPVESEGATSFRRVRTRTYRVPMYPGADPRSWRDHDAALRAPRSTARADQTLAG
jgi:microcystin degradation protein MlrC